MLNSATPRAELINSIKMRHINIKNENIYGKPNSKIKNMSKY